MTFDDDFVRIEFDGGNKNYSCNTMGITWPPAEVISVMGFDFYRVSMSEISDRDRAALTCVIRGALYRRRVVTAESEQK